MAQHRHTMGGASDPALHGSVGPAIYAACCDMGDGVRRTGQVKAADIYTQILQILLPLHRRNFEGWPAAGPVSPGMFIVVGQIAVRTLSRIACFVDTGMAAPLSVTGPARNRLSRSVSDAVTVAGCSFDGRYQFRYRATWIRVRKSARSRRDELRKRRRRFAARKNLGTDCNLMTLSDE